MIEKTYQPSQIEPEIQAKWEKAGIFHAKDDSDKKKFYCLPMFAYPSGNIHMGHVRNYTINDVIARHHHMMGENVLQATGFDAFGLPAENAAIEKGIAPAKWTYSNIDHMCQQYKQLGIAYDWDRVVITCKPEYYRWNQWLFLKMHEKGLAYRKKSIVNWDPVDQTVLANEQVIDGRGWRSGALIEQREIYQWFFKITDYAEELLKDLDQLTEWPEQVCTMQRNWIGRSEGVEIKFRVENEQTPLDVYTTRADTLFGVTFLAIAAQHPLAKIAMKQNAKIKPFIEKCQHIKTAEADMATIEKEGMDTGLKAIHPLTNEKIPIWVTNYVLMDYGSGAVMAVPAHDQRDFEFAEKYDLPIKQVIKPSQEDEKIDLEKEAFTEKGILINADTFSDMSSEQAINAIADTLTKAQMGQRKVNYRLRDWGISRQRYWGTPIPMIYCEYCGNVPVPEKDLPVLLPEDVQFHAAQSPLKTNPGFYETTCPKCGKPAKRETDTFDTFVDSSWYYARYACPHDKEKMLDEQANHWLPVDLYVGGIEHAILHLLYARFITKVLRDLGLLNIDEPFKKLLTQGMVLKDGAKMSKSKGNTVDPKALIDQYGTDTVRVFSIFAAPPEQSLEWSDSGVEGAYRFLKRLWSLAYDNQDVLTQYATLFEQTDWQTLSTEAKATRREIHLILQQAQYDMERLQLNTVVSGSMKLLNTLQKIDADKQAPVFCEGFSLLLRLLSPIAPHITQHLWQQLGYGTLIVQADWPKVDTAILESDQIELVIQVNGKLRGSITVDRETDKATIEQLAIEQPKIQALIDGKSIKRMIVVPHKLVNIVV